MKNPVQSYYNQLAHNYDKDRFGNSYGQFIDLQERNLMKKWIKSLPSQRILDIGCGTGRFMDFATDGLDFSEKMLQVAQSKYPDKEFYQASATKLPFKDNSFDVVFSWHVMMHLPQEDIRQILGEVKRVLKPKGLFLFDLPSYSRRQLVVRKKSGWHGDTSIPQATLKSWFSSDWVLRNYEGIMLTPIHRFPKRVRSAVFGLDQLLCKSPLKKWASYHLFVLEKS